MKLLKSTLLSSAVVLGLSLSAPALADNHAHSNKDAQLTETESTTVTKTYKTYNKTLNPMKFDQNNDMNLTLNEIGTGLFYIYDVDGNEVIDNIEYDKYAVATQTPVEIEQYKFVDPDGDGISETQTYEYDRFMKYSRLSLFDQEKDGLTAADFLDTSFYNVDDDDNGVISMAEWKEEYLPQTKQRHEESERYQD